MTPIILPLSTSPERSRLLSVNLIRKRALERLYERRETVLALIDSLERYQRHREQQTPNPMDVSAVQKCS